MKTSAQSPVKFLKLEFLTIPIEFNSLNEIK